MKILLVCLLLVSLLVSGCTATEAVYVNSDTPINVTGNVTVTNQPDVPTISYAHITTANTTLLVTGSGTFLRVVINTSTSDNVTIYDGIDATGSVIAKIEPWVPWQYDYGVPFTTGLVIKTDATGDFTVIWSD